MKAFIILVNKKEPKLYIIKAEFNDANDYEFTQMAEYTLNNGSSSFNAHFVAATILGSDLIVYVVTQEGC